MMKSSHIRLKPSSMRLNPSCLWRKPSTTRPASQQPSRLAVAMAVACAAVLTGCSSMAPSYQRPESPVPDTFRDGAAAADAVRGSQVAGHGQRMQDRHHGGWADGMVASPQAGKGAGAASRTGAASAGAPADDTMTAMPDWQQLFVDERLRQVIALALDNNRDLRVAMLNIEMANYGSELGQAINALELVVGSRVPDALLPEPGAHVDADAVALAPLPANLSSKVLLERPDVLAAEHTLKAANANIGAARAAFFPTISLTATTGRSSDSLSSLFDGGRGTWTFMPSISVPIFNAGSLKGSLDSAKIASAIEVANYEKAIQTAFSEVANALAVRARVQEQLDAQKAYVNTMTRAHRLAEARYRHGVQSYLEALDAQRTLYSAQQSLITLLLQEASNRVTLYKVLGGDAQAQAGAAASGTALR